MINSLKEKILIFTDWFYPGYKAGGPIQSLTNLVVKLEESYDIFVITSAYDLHKDIPYFNISINEWNLCLLPESIRPVSIWYAEKKNLSSKLLKHLITKIRPETLYLNGIFSYKFFLLPLITLRKLTHRPKVIICPRGMLQHGALEGKQLKKKFYIASLKLSGLLKNISWHATNEQEMMDIKKVFGKKQLVHIASNIPKKPITTIQLPQKKVTQLRLVYLSLIAEKKNLLVALEAVKKNANVTLDIYGPLKDKSYWRRCENLILQMAEQAIYKGEILPEKVQEIFMQYDAFILLTKGENFGHALYESLSVGRPIITSFYTPWNNLERQKAGWNVNIDNNNEVVLLLNSLANMSSTEFDEFSRGAHTMAMNYYNDLNSIDEYTILFSGNKNQIKVNRINSDHFSL